jgi:hypothetical protein
VLQTTYYIIYVKVLIITSFRYKKNKKIALSSLNKLASFLKIIVNFNEILHNTKEEKQLYYDSLF